MSAAIGCISVCVQYAVALLFFYMTLVVRKPLLLRVVLSAAHVFLSYVRGIQL